MSFDVASSSGRVRFVGSEWQDEPEQRRLRLEGRERHDRPAVEADPVEVEGLGMREAETESREQDARSAEVETNDERRAA